ncbi:MAG: cupin domain-containing protein [Thermoleophilaceae bacterium]|nr:cupin domain-containing protein [Thermoleophilaceae bacterium]
MAETVVRQPGQGDAYWLLGALFDVKVATPELTLVEVHLRTGAGPPPHTHPGGESVYVLEGRIRYHIDGAVHEGGPGAFFHVPQDTPENFEPVEDSRLLVAYTPGGIEGFIAEAGERAPRHELPPPPVEPPDVGRLVEIGRRHGMNLVLPA